MILPFGASPFFPKHSHALSAASAPLVPPSVPLSLNQLLGKVGHSLNPSSPSHQAIVRPKPPRKPFSFSSSLERVSNPPKQSDVEQGVKQVQVQQSTLQHAESGATLFGHDPEQLFKHSPTIPEPSEIQHADEQQDPVVATHVKPETESNEPWMVVTRETVPKDDALQTIPENEGDGWIHVDDPKDLPGVQGTYEIVQ